MAWFNELFLNYYFLSCLIAWILSVVLKMFISSVLKNKSLDVKDGFKNGGMPSSHSALVTSITFSVFLMQGFSSLFFVALAFALIIMSDAFMLRYNVGLQAQELNVLLGKAKRKPIPIVKGHTFAQVVGGAAIGLIVPYVLYLILF